MRKTLIIYFLLLLLLPATYSFGQRWKRTRYEVFLGLGISTLQGDLGGSTSELIDYDFFGTRYAFNIGARYKLSERVALKLDILPVGLAGSDSYTKSESRAPRDLSSSSFILETSVQCEVSVIKEKLSSRYTFRNMRDFKFKNINTYLFLGIGGFYMHYNVKGEDLLTTTKFKGYQFTIPMGVGVKYGINRKLALNIEYGLRKTFTDGIDGVSRDPYSKRNDLYMLLMVKLVRKLKTSRTGWPTF